MDKQNLETRIMERAWQDPSFRQRLLENPKDVIENELGEKLPDSLEICILQDSPQKLHLVIPADPAPDRTLSAEELDIIAGGSMFTVMGANHLSLCFICR